MFEKNKGYTMRILILSICCFFFLSSYAQHRVNLLTGHEFSVKTYEIKGDYLNYIKTGSSKSNKHKMFIDRIYSVEDSLLGERLLYQPDTTDTLEYNVADMRLFIEGEKHALKTYRKPLTAVGATAVGACGVVFLGVYGLVAPFGYVAATNAFTPKLNTNIANASPYINHQVFKDGYGYRARKMKAKTGFIFGGLGLLLGSGIFILSNQ
jgi:hypothetical protein